MRWHLAQQPEPGDTRTVRRFLWWPTLGGWNEVRWLERVTISQEWVVTRWGGRAHGWRNTGFTSP